jgi:hypothetical protein
MKTLLWVCTKCSAKTLVNMTHARVAAGTWRPGIREKMLCKCCGQTRSHIIETAGQESE